MADHMPTRNAYRGIRVADLPNPADRYVGNVFYKGPFLYCAQCGAEYSANRADYFLRNPAEIMRCCGRPLRLVRRETRLVNATAE